MSWVSTMLPHTGDRGLAGYFLILADDVRQFLEWLVIICKVVFQCGPCLEGWQGGPETKLVVEKGIVGVGSLDARR